MGPFVATRETFLTSQPSSGPFAAFFEFRDNLRRGPIGDGGLDTCHALSDALDGAIRASIPGGPGDGVAVVAIGGYGRREQSLYSDVDVMLLHGGGETDAAVRAVLYPLWDTSLKVGHAVRTVAECAAAGAESLETLTALMSPRLIAGDGDLLHRLEETLRTLLRGRPLTARLTAAERERRLAEPRPLMASDVKQSRGGLRTFQSFWWERRHAELIAISPPYQETPEERTAHRSLLAVRNGLHAAAGKAVDRFVTDLREPAAQWLRTDVWGISERATRALRTGDHLALHRWPDLTARPLGLADRLRRGRRRSGAATPLPRRALAIAVDSAQRPGGTSMTPAERETVATEKRQDWIEEDRENLLRLLRLGERGREGFEWLDSLGWVANNLPEFTHVAAAPQIAPFHEHPVDTHLLRTAEEMRSLIAGTDPWLGSVADEVGAPDLLLLTAFLHDVGKALPGDHSVVGEEIADVLCRRVGFTEFAEPVAGLVRDHLLLTTTATRRDTADPRVIADVAAQCASNRRLQMLYLLSVADARATGAAMWSDWKATLLKNLYIRVAAVLEPDLETSQDPFDAVAAIAGLDRDVVGAHSAAMAADYEATHTAIEIAAHVGLAGGRPGSGPAISIIDEASATPRLVVVAGDQPGLLRAIAGVLTLHNLAILDARLETRSDGMAFDTFHVAKIHSDVELDAEATARIENDLAAALAGTIDLAALVAAKTLPYRTPTAEKLVVSAPTDPTLRYTAIEVRCSDRPGALFDIVDELYGADLDVQAARIDTRGDAVRGLFYVLNKGGQPIRDVNDLQPLVAGVRSSLRERL